jgi:hypothetical protein
MTEQVVAVEVDPTDVELVVVTDPDIAQHVVAVDVEVTQGSPGAQGPQGPVGPQGVQGIQGPVGPVSSVGLALPAEFTVAGSPVTGAGTLAGSWASQTAAKVLASPSGATGPPGFRALIASDIPALSYLPLTGGPLTGPLSVPSVTVGPTFTPPAGAMAAVYNNAAAANLYLIGDGQPVNFLDTRYTSDTSPPVFSFVKYRGSYAAPAAVVTGDNTGFMNFDGWDGSAVQVLSRILGAAQTFNAAGDISGSLAFQTRTTGPGGVLTTALSIDQAQIVTLAQLPVWPSVVSNRFWAGPVGGPGPPAMRKLDASDLPLPSPTTLGGIQSVAAVASNWVRSISNAGAPVLSRPAAADLSDYATGQPWTPTLTCATPGDLSVAYTTQTGRWVKIGTTYFWFLSLSCTPTYTTAAGTLLISGFPATPSFGGQQGLLSQLASPPAWPSGVLQAVLLWTGNQLEIGGLKPGSNTIVWPITTFTSGQNLIIAGQGILFA